MVTRKSCVDIFLNEPLKACCKRIHKKVTLSLLPNNERHMDKVNVAPKATPVCLPTVMFITLPHDWSVSSSPKRLSVAEVLGASVRVNKISTPVVLDLKIETCHIFRNIAVK
jgi:hypothetical protein